MGRGAKSSAPTHGRYYYAVASMDGQSSQLSGEMVQSATAKTTKTWFTIITCITSVVTVAVIVFSSTTTSSLLVKAYGLTIWLLISIDLWHLVFQYARLAAGAKAAFGKLSLLSNESNPDVHSTLIAVLNYQFLRSAAPPILKVFKTLYSKRLQTTWNEVLSMHSLDNS